MLLLLILPASALFVGGAIAKARYPRAFEYQMLAARAPWLAERRRVMLLSSFEAAAGLLGPAVPWIGPIALSPMLFGMAAFTGFLVLKRPSNCGCGLLDVGWRTAAFRNALVVALMLLFLWSRGLQE